MDLIFNGLGLWQNFGDQKKVMESKKKKKEFLSKFINTNLVLNSNSYIHLKTNA